MDPFSGRFRGTRGEGSECGRRGKEGAEVAYFLHIIAEYKESDLKSGPDSSGESKVCAFVRLPVKGVKLRGQVILVCGKPLITGSDFESDSLCSKIISSF